MICNWILCRRRAADSHIWQHPDSHSSGNIQPAPELVPAVWGLQCSTLTLCCLDNSSCNPTKAWEHTYVTIIQTLTNEQILYLKDWRMTGCCLPKGWFNRLATIYLLIITTKKLKVPTSSSQVTLKLTSSAVHVVGSSVGQMEQSKLWHGGWYVAIWEIHRRHCQPHVHLG